MNDQPKSRWYWRLLRWVLIGVAILGTLAAVLITEEDWRGKHDWDAYKRAAEARGERLDLAAVVPPPVPDDQNFFCAPIVAEALFADQNPQAHTNPALNRMDFNIWPGTIGTDITQGGNWQKGTLTDLKQWQTAFRKFSAEPEAKTYGFPVPAQPQTPAADVLLALSVYDPPLGELRQASERPYMRIPLNYENGFDSASELLPWLANLKRCAQFLHLRATAEEQNGQGGPALDDIKLLVRVNDCIREQPFLISHLVRLAIMNIMIQPIYEGLAQHCWSDAQLAELEQVLAGQDFLADYKFAMKGEEIFAIDSFEKQRVTRQMKVVVDSLNSSRVVTNSLRWLPSAYFYQNELSFATMYENNIRQLVDFTNRIVWPSRVARTVAEIQAQTSHFAPYHAQAYLLSPSVAKAVEKFAFTQAAIDLAGVACALERYRLAHGEYPATLDALAPQFIDQVPHDIINGQPLHYRLTDGKFVLYSVGWNATDDGGTVVLTKGGSIDREKGDWVWKY
jgi:hypothetical protein